MSGGILMTTMLFIIHVFDFHLHESCPNVSSKWAGIPPEMRKLCGWEAAEDSDIKQTDIADFG